MPPRFDPTPQEFERFRRLVEVDHRIYRDIAVEMGWPRRRVQKLVTRYRLKGRPVKQVSGADHPCWKGGRVLDKDGYILVYRPDHPNATRGRRHMILEHRLVMEQHLGRYLDPKEVVHHRNKNKQDNRIENLQLFSENSEHLRHELTGKCPNWTEAGREAIRAGVKKRWSKSRGPSPDAWRKPGKKTRRPG